MFEKMFEVAVVFSAIDHLTSPLAKMGKQLGVLQKQSAATQKQLNQFKAMAVTGGAITLAGAGLAKGLISAVDSAGRLQTSMMGVKESLGLTNEEMAKMSDMAQSIGIPTIFSSEEVGGIMQAMATAGLSKQQVMDPNILKEYVNFADVQAQIKHENAPDVVSSGINMAHQYQLYSTDQITPFLNSLNAALLHTHATASEFGTTYKYIANQSRTMGMSADNTLAATAWLDRMGFGSGKGGTNFADFLQRSIYHSSGSKADSAMEQAGFVQNGHSVFENAQGQFVGIPAAVQIMQDFAKRFNNNANVMNPLLHDIFGTQGARVAMMMTSQGASDQYTNVQQQIGQSAGIDQAQDELNKTWQGKLKQLETTLQDISQAFGKSVMPMFLPVVNVLDDILGRVLEFEQTHPKIMAWIATFAGIAAAAALVVGPLMIMVGALGYLSTAGMVGAGFSILTKSLTGMLGPLALVATAGYLLYKAWQSDFGGIQEKSAVVFNWIKAELPNAEAALKRFATALGFLSDSGLHIPAWAKWTAGVLLGVRSVTGLITGLNMVLGPFAALTNFIGSGSRILVGLMSFSSFILRITGLTKLWTAAQMALNIAMDMNPVGLIIIGVAALIGIVILLIKYWHQVVSAVKLVAAEFTKMPGWLQGVIAAWLPFIGIPLEIIAHWQQIVSFFQNLPSEMHQFGVDLVNGLKIGIQEGWTALTGVWNDLVSHLPASLASHLQIHSPSRVMMQMGGYISQGLALGISSNKHLVANASDQLADAAMGGNGSSYAQLSPRALGGGGDTHIHIASGAIVIQPAAGREQAATDAALQTITRQAVTRSRARGTRPVTAY